jgi:hypothetical protein
LGAGRQDPPAPATWFVPALVSSWSIAPDFRATSAVPAGSRRTLSAHWISTPMSTLASAPFNRSRPLPPARSAATLLTGRPAQPIERRRDRWVVADAVEAPLLVGAGGHFCPVAKMLNAPREDRSVVVAQECEFRLSPEDAAESPIRGDTPELYFCHDRRGYGWCVRKGDYLNIGFGRLGPLDFRRHEAGFVACLKERTRVPEGLPLKWPGHAYRIYARPLRRMVDEGVVLIGDAAGLAHPVSGEGILTAVESGRLAAKVIAATGPGDSRRRLAEYPALLEQRYGRPATSAAEPWMLPSSLVSWMGVRLMGMPWFVRRVLLGQWFLHRQLSPLVVG